MDTAEPPEAETFPHAGVLGVDATLARNIAALRERRAHEEHQRGTQARIADAVTAFAGSLPFVYLHGALVIFWAAANLGLLPGVPRFDRTFVILATVASVEAIFLSTFVLISQNRQAAEADRRADLDLQINLLAEHEISKLAALLAAVAEKVGVEPDAGVRKAAQEVAPEAVMDLLEDGAGRAAEA